MSLLDGPDKGRYTHIPLLRNSSKLADYTHKPHIPAECLHHDCVLIPSVNLPDLYGISTLEYDGRLLSIHFDILPPYHPPWPRQHCFSSERCKCRTHKWPNRSIGLHGKYQTGIIEGQVTTKDFRIDGKSGEIITEVHFAAENSSSFRLATNRGRLGTFGACNDETQWQVFTPEAGYYIAGLTSCCGNLEGWDEELYKWTCTSLSDLGVVVARNAVVEYEVKEVKRFGNWSRRIR
jgi:hypothetical protein